MDDDSAATASKRFNSNLLSPYFTILANRWNDYNKKYKIFLGFNTEASNVIVGKNLISSDNDRKEVFATIAINSSENDSAFAIFNSYDSSEFDNEIDFLTTVLGNYMIMTQYIRYCTGTTLQTVYVPNYSCVEDDYSKLNVIGIHYAASGINWDYDGTSKFDITKIKNIFNSAKYEYDDSSESFTLSTATSGNQNLYEQANALSKVATNLAEATANEYVIKYNAVTNNSVFLDESYVDGNESNGVRLESLVDRISWDSVYGFTCDSSLNENMKIEMRNKPSNYVGVLNILPNYTFSE